MAPTTFKVSKLSVMKTAWAMKKDQRFGWGRTFSFCLKAAWKEEKRKAERYNDYIDFKYGLGKYSYNNRVESKPRTLDLSYMAGTLTDYYRNNTYNGD